MKTLLEFANTVDYSFTNTLSCDPDAQENGQNYDSREVFSGHYVPVNPTPIENPEYVTHSKDFFKELGLEDSLAQDEEFIRVFSGDTSNVPDPLKSSGWACGYALSIYGTEYYNQCPFQTGNGYGDGRAISIYEGILNGKRWEMQLKGGGRTSYCRGADGRAVLRSSVREFLAQEHMHSLGIPTSRSLTFYRSTSETVKRPWFNERSFSKNPEIMIDEYVAISTRVAPSFIRVGQLELFARRARKNEHPKALEELEQIVLHLIDREYSNLIDKDTSLEEKILVLARQFQDRLTSLVANWIRVGYCQGNFNSDNCAAGGFTLDYGPFGFIDMFDPRYQPWTGGGVHFSFLNQPYAAQKNYDTFCSTLKPLLDQNGLDKLQTIQDEFPQIMQEKMKKMWASKLGLEKFDVDLVNDLIRLMVDTSVDYTIFFRELSSIPDGIESLIKSFYDDRFNDGTLLERWSLWLEKWKSHIYVSAVEDREELSKRMKQVNPKYTLREWILVPAYKQAVKGDYTLIKELQEIMTNPYAEQSKEIEEKYYREKPLELFDIAGVSHITCSS